MVNEAAVDTGCGEEVEAAPLTKRNSGSHWAALRTSREPKGRKSKLTADADLNKRCSPPKAAAADKKD
ncbi:hypothetical protein, partial [Myxococcus fulvus]|uniref:hypothetical protein n=1 Tax=Myxococcus fulvus TaxID=33 RepID=UPI001C3F8A53